MLLERGRWRRLSADVISLVCCGGLFECTVLEYMLSLLFHSATTDLVLGMNELVFFFFLLSFSLLPFVSYSKPFAESFLIHL